MESLRVSYTEVWVPSTVAPLIQFADRVRGIASTGLDTFAIPGLTPRPDLVECLRSFDSIVSWYGTNREELREEFERTGLNGSFFPALPPLDSPIHCADFFAQQVRAPKPAIPRLHYERQPAQDSIIIHPFSGSASKNWPLVRFQELARRLAGHLPGRVVWTAGPDEALPGAERFETLDLLGQRLANSRLYVGNDSGITHLAAACGARVVALFGPTNPRVWAPRGEHIAVLHQPLESISVEQVLRACDTISWS